MERDKQYDIVVVSGGFDPVHKGHVRMFEAAKQLGYKVIAGANSDAWLVRKKGKAFMNFAERAEIIRAFRAVDEVLPFNDDDDTAINLLVRVQTMYPDCTIAFANGGDRVDGNTPEAGFSSAYKIDMLWNVGGGKIQSSSDLIKAAGTK
jgi:cytidyltransferase-like protein